MLIQANQMMANALLHISLVSATNDAEPDQTPHGAASDQTLHCLLAYRMYFQNVGKIVNYYPTTLKRLK